MFQFISGHSDSFYDTASKLQMAHYTAGQYVFKEGEPGYHFYIVLDGEVCITRKKVVLITLSSGQCFGEYALVEILIPVLVLGKLSMFCRRTRMGFALPQLSQLRTLCYYHYTRMTTSIFLLHSKQVRITPI